MKYQLVLISALFVSSLQVQANPVTDLFGESVAWQAPSFVPAVFQDNAKRQKGLDACKDKKEGDSCEFEGRNGKVTGTCKKTRNDKLICKSENRRHKRRKNKD